MRTSRLLLLLLFITVHFTGFAQTAAYSKVRVHFEGRAISDVAALGIETDHGLVKKGVFIETDLSATEILKAQAAGFRVEVLIPDVVQYYQQQNLPTSVPLTGNRLCAEPIYDVPQNFHLGSMGGYFTYQEMLDMLDSMAAKFPNLITARAVIDTALTTVQGRPLYWMKMTGPGVSGPKPQILYTALHHAREPGSLSQLIYYMFYLLEHYATDTNIQYLLDHTEMYFVPCVNPDGYIYNETTNPTGGGLWRKNRLHNADSTYGVDLNRNYGYNWGYDNIGSSPNTADDTYRGTAPFSEPEIQMMKEFNIAHHFLIALNYHTYGGFLVYPWGYLAQLFTPDSNFFSKAGDFLTRENRYIAGTGDITVGYTTNGDSDDWNYGEQTLKNKIFSMTPEVGSDFWDPSSSIIEICRKNIFQNLEAARMLLPRATVKDKNPTILQSDSGILAFEVTRLGLPDSVSYTLTITSITPGVQITPASVTLDNMALAETRADTFQYTIDTTGRANNQVNYLVTISGGGISYTDTFTRYYGGYSLVFYEPCNDMNRWTSVNGYGIDTSTYYSSPASFGDSPGRDYDVSTTISLTTDSFIDLTNASAAMLTFYGRWDIETSFDYAQVLASTDGTNWTPLCGQYTHSGSFYQDRDNPLYDGHQLQWLQETIDLNSYAGQKMMLRFQTVSDPAVVYGGFNFDELKIWAQLRNRCQLLQSAIEGSSNYTIMAATDTTTLHAQVTPGATYQWLLNDTAITNATDTVLKIAGGGIITLLTSDSGCIQTSSAVNINLLTVSGLSSAATVNGLSVKVSPNPFYTSLNINFDISQQGPVSITLKDILGRELSRKEINAATGTNHINWLVGSDLAQGVYLLAVQSNNGAVVLRVVKE